MYETSKHLKIKIVKLISKNDGLRTVNENAENTKKKNTTKIKTEKNKRQRENKRKKKKKANITLTMGYSPSNGQMGDIDPQ